MTDNHDDGRDDDGNNNPNNPNNPKNDDYDVGYRKPPKEHQFPPGQSGNPKGRKKGSRGLKTDLGAELRSKVPVTENGKTRNLTKQQIVLKALITKAVKGDVKAAMQVVSMTMQMFGVEDEPKGKSKLSAADEALLDDYLASLSGSSEPPPGWPSDPDTPASNNVSDDGERRDVGDDGIDEEDSGDDN